MCPWLLTVEQDELPDGVIERRPHVVDGVSEQYPPAFTLGFLAEFDGKRVAACLLIEVLDFRVRVTVRERLNLSVEGLHVLVSAPVFGAGASE